MPFFCITDMIKKKSKKMEKNAYLTDIVKNRKKRNIMKTSSGSADDDESE